MAHEQQAAATIPGPSTVPVLNSNVMCVVLLGDRPAIDVRGDAGHGQGRTDRVRQDLPGALLIVPSNLGSKVFWRWTDAALHTP